jgi:hypothetical protein
MVIGIQLYIEATTKEDINPTLMLLSRQAPCFKNPLTMPHCGGDTRKEREEEDSPLPASSDAPGGSKVIP